MPASACSTAARSTRSPSTNSTLPAEMREILALARAQVVEHADPVAALDQRRRDVRTDEAGAAGDQVCAHATSLHTVTQIDQPAVSGSMELRSRGAAAKTAADSSRGGRPVADGPPVAGSSSMTRIVSSASSAAIRREVAETGSRWRDATSGDAVTIGYGGRSAHRSRRPAESSAASTRARASQPCRILRRATPLSRRWPRSHRARSAPAARIRLAAVLDARRPRAEDARQRRETVEHQFFFFERFGERVDRFRRRFAEHARAARREPCGGRRR